MKKLILSAVAMLAFGIASAQTDPKTPPTSPTPTVTPKEEKLKTDANTQSQVPATSEQRRQMDDAQPRKDELKTRDHVKSTPAPEVAKDKTDDKKKSAKKSETKKSN